MVNIPYSALLSKLKALKDAGKYCDVILNMGDKTVEAHKIVLAAWSPYFENMLTNGEVGKEHLTVSCENHEDAFVQLVDFMYSGRATVSDSNVARLLSLADQFQVEPLMRQCEEFLKSNIHIKNFVTVFGLARRFRLQSLQENIASFIQQNLSEAAKQPEFNSLSPSWIYSFISMDSMLALKPEYKVFLIVGWISADFENREKYLALLFSKMSWVDLSSDFLLEISKSENFFTSNMSCLFLLLNSISKAGLPLGPYTEGFQHIREKNKDICSRTQVDKVADISDDQPVSAILLFKQSNVKDVMNQTSEREDPGKDDFYRPVSPTDSLSEHSPEEENPAVDDTWKPPVSQSSAAKPGTDGKPCRRSTRRKGVPVKVAEDADYDIAQKDQSLPPPKQKRKTLKSDTTEPPVKMRRKRGRPPKGTKNTDAAEKFPPKVGKPARGRGRPRKVRIGENGEGREKCASGNFLKEDVTGNVAEDKPLSTRERNTWRKCDIEGCDFSTKVIEEMEEHMVNIHEKEQTHCCNVCDFRSSYQRIYLTHMKVHFDGPPFSCDYPPCTYKTERIQPLLTHRMIHTDEKPYECEICQAKFRSTIYLQIHERSHTGERPFECDTCKRAFSTKGTLDMHLISHTNSRPFLCDTCGFATKYQSHLIAHKRIHTGEVFRCRYPNCSYSTPKRSLIKAHLRSHLGIRGHTCTTCGRAFVEKSHLVRHEKIHLEDKPFKCSQCIYSSTRRDKLKEHVTRHHSGESPAMTTPYKPHKNRRPKEPLPPPTLTDGAVQLLEQMVQSSAPTKYGTKPTDNLDETELVNNIQQLQQEQRRFLERREKVQQEQVQASDILPQQESSSQQSLLTGFSGKVHPHQTLDEAAFVQQHQTIGSLSDSLVRVEGQGGDYSGLQTSSLSQSLEHLQSPHVSVSILRGDGHLSQDAVAFVQSVADSVVLDTQPPIMSHNAQTTTMNNVTITTLEFIK